MSWILEAYGLTREDVRELTRHQQVPQKKKSGRPGRPVKCLVDGQEKRYEKIKDVEKDGFCWQGVWQAINKRTKSGERTRHCGRYWYYADGDESGHHTPKKADNS